MDEFNHEIHETHEKIFVCFFRTSGCSVVHKEVAQKVLQLARVVLTVALAETGRVAILT